MKRLLVVILCSLALYSCATEKIVYKDRIVKVPEIVMEQCPSPPYVAPLGPLPIKTLHAGSSNQDIAKAYVKTVEILDIKILQYKAAWDVLNNE